MIRKGELHTHPSRYFDFHLNALETKTIYFGSLEDQYLNGITLHWIDNEAKAQKTATIKIIEPGVSPCLDWFLNTSKTIEICPKGNFVMAGEIL